MQVKQSDLMFRPGLMKGERVLVTGGGSGLGAVIAEACLIGGAEVYICGRRAAVLEKTADAMMASHGGSVRPIACDIRSEAAIDGMVEEAWRDGPLTGLVNNAAGNFLSRTQDLSPRGFDAISNIVFRGSFLTTLACGKRWIAEGSSASVLSILVSWVWNGAPFMVPSAMSKAGVNIMTKSLAVEWGGRGIRLNAIVPGSFPTEGMVQRLKVNEENAYGDMSHNPLGRVGAMPELANLAVFLLARGSEYINGQTIAIDGGEDLVRRNGAPDRRSWTDEDWRRARAMSDAANAADRAPGGS